MKLFRRKRVKKGDLRNIDVELISLLFDEVKPANGKGVVVKSAKGKSYTHIANATKFKSDNEGRLFVTVMEPDTLDSQGDTITKAEVVKAMDHFAIKGMIGRNDMNHNMTPINDVNIVENYLLKAADAEHFPSVKNGSWVQVLKCDLAGETWKKVKADQFNGVSIYGTAEDVAVAHADNSKMLEELKEIRKAILATGDKASLKVIDEKIETIEKADSSLDNKDLIKSINEMIVTLNKAINKSIVNEPGKGDMKEEKEIVIKGEKITVQEYHREIVEKFAQNGEPEAMNILSETNSDQFVDEVLETVDDDTLKEITVTNMTKDNKIDAGLIADLVLKNEDDGEPTVQTIVSGEIEITPGILKGEYRVSRTTQEAYKDKYGEDAYLAYVLKKLANKSLKALKKLLFKGDRGSGTAALKALDGVIALAGDGSDVTNINTTTYGTYALRLQYALQQFGEDYLEHMDQFVIYCSMKDLISIRAEAENKPNNKAARIVLDGKNVWFDGIPVKGRFMTNDYIIIGVPAFIIIGVRSDAEVYRRFIPWYYYWYIRLRAGITYVTGFVKVFYLTSGS